MPTEALTNNLQTQLSAAIASTSATAISIASAAGFPSGQLLTANQASLETGTTGWAVGTNCTIAQTAAQALDGTKALSLTASSAADMSATTLTGTSGVAVTAGALYSAYAYFRTAVNARSVTCGINWYTSGGALIGSTVFGTAATDATTGWVQATVTAQAPNNAAFAAVVAYVTAPANGEVHYIDVIWLAAGPVTQWRILIDSEIMVVTGGHGLTTWIVTRGAEGTTAATHLNNATVIQLLTQGGLANLDQAFWPFLQPAGLTGAAQQTRYVGGTVLGPPTIGTFQLNDMVVDQGGSVWVCTAAGPPGTWVQVGTNYTFRPVEVSQASATQTLTHSAFTKVIFDTVVYDPAAAWSTVNGNIILSQPGMYVISGAVAFNGAATTTAISSIFVGGVEYVRMFQFLEPNAATIIVPIFAVLWVSATGVKFYPNANVLTTGATVDIRIWQNNPGNTDVTSLLSNNTNGPATWLTIAFVGGR